MSEQKHMQEISDVVYRLRFAKASDLYGHKSAIVETMHDRRELDHRRDSG